MREPIRCYGPLKNCLRGEDIYRQFNKEMLEEDYWVRYKLVNAPQPVNLKGYLFHWTEIICISTR